MNELAETFKDKPVQFISITDEPEEIVAPFLARRTLKGWVGIDSNRATFRAYGVSGIPRTVVVDQRGTIVAAMTGTEEGSRLNAETINRIVTAGLSNAAGPSPAGAKAEMASQRGQSAVVTGREGRTVGTDEARPATDVPSLLDITIRPSAMTMSTIIAMPTSFRATGADVASLVQSLLRIRSTRISIPPEQQNRRFDITAVLPNEKREGFAALILTALENALAIRVRRVTREIDALVLTVPGKLGDGLRPTAAKAFHASSDKGVLAASAAGFENLCADIEDVMRIPTVDETGLQGKFDWDLLYDSGNPSSILGAVRRDLGLELTTRRRPIEMVVVDTK